MKSKCSKNEIYRVGYKKKSGTKVKGKCIKAQSYSGEKTSIKVKKMMKEKSKMHKEAEKKFGKPSKCGKDEIIRDGYKVKAHDRVLKDGTKIHIKSHWVAPVCVESQVQRSSKGKKIIPIMEKDILKPFGYVNIKNKSKTERENSLKKAIKEIKPISIYRRLIALATLNKEKDKKLHDILRDDADFVRKYF